MSNSSEEVAMRSDEAVEELLEMASPRPTPPGEDEIAVRDAVHAEWHAITGKIQTRRRVTYFAIAATVLLGIAVSFNALQVTNVPALEVATISKSHGSIYLLGEQSELQEASDLASISTGQVIVTGADAGIGIDWGNGGSLRVDQNTRIRFTSTESVYLVSGQIYFDSQPSQLVAGITGSGLEIETQHGSVTHLGTQYMTYADERTLKVSVREGKVSVDSAYFQPEDAVTGQQLTVLGGSRPTFLDIDGYGEAWDWVEATAPNVSMNGRSAYDFLHRIARETGLKVEFEDAAAEALAHKGILNGTLDMAPRAELALRMSGEDLSYRIDEGAIKVSAIDSSSHP